MFVLMQKLHWRAFFCRLMRLDWRGEPEVLRAEKGCSEWRSKCGNVKNEGLMQKTNHWALIGNIISGILQA